jgi:hypothetical protein
MLDVSLVQRALQRLREVRDRKARRLAGYKTNGLNGPRAVARRERQRLTGHNDQSRGFVR